MSFRFCPVELTFASLDLEDLWRYSVTTWMPETDTKTKTPWVALSDVACRVAIYISTLKTSYPSSSHDYFMLKSTPTVCVLLCLLSAIVRFWFTFPGLFFSQISPGKYPVLPLPSFQCSRLQSLF